jgi:hypothetical protein
MPGQDVLDRLGLDLDPGQGSVERRRPEIVKARRARPDEHDIAGELSRVVRPVEYRPSRDEGRRVRRTEAEPDGAVGIGRELDAAPLDVVEAGRRAERGFPARI